MYNGKAGKIVKIQTHETYILEIKKKGEKNTEINREIGVFFRIPSGSLRTTLKPAHFLFELQRGLT